MAQLESVEVPCPDCGEYLSIGVSASPRTLQSVDGNYVLKVRTHPSSCRCGFRYDPDSD